VFKPEYSENFRCIGPACEDSCCEQWTVYVDQSTFEKLQSLPAGPLSTLIDANVLRNPEQTNAPGGAASAFAQIRMAEDSKCPLLSTEGLCRVHQEYGESHLPHMCATYPRALYSVQGETEKALALSCPEAARLVLLDPHLPLSAPQDRESPTSNVGPSGSNPWQSHFWPVRDFALTLVRNRAYPLWQRLFLLDLFSRRLDAIAPGELNEKVPALLSGFTTAIQSGSLLPGMQALAVDHAKQLDLVMRLAGMLLKRSNLRPRFIECIQAFTQGIGNGPATTFESLTARYVDAHDRYFAPFFLRHPHILENYLINTIFRCRFPFGSEWARNGAVPSMSRESALLIAQFALMKGLLIGVSGFHREKFSADHVVHTIQAASKHFDHHLDFLKDAHALLIENHVDGSNGLVILLRNQESTAGQSAAPSIQPSLHTLAGVEGIPFTAQSSVELPMASGD
jgi:lysine-N-methylase